ncbi:hypothetical protein ONS95_000275 [Cadophora gregata]|uniref:uncharacterized protein n=1 Tax=Cadophora gregata TaxID=51156 RepID=UPI0026DADE39|nr:uncharacterized protein ONS95_000275 [Cadophora gregata]KAK0128300.1 hypothetical protein ONS95_000275 [Cadophora gregata]
MTPDNLRVVTEASKTAQKTNQGPKFSSLSQYTTGQTSTMAATNPSPLLRLPAEIRTLIYAYLVPNHHPYIWYEFRRRTTAGLFYHRPATFLGFQDNFAGRWYRSDRIHLRADRADPSLALLRTCREIYEEYVKEFYGHARFSILALPGEIRFFNQRIKDAGFGFKIIKYLDVTINVPGPGDGDNNEKMAVAGSRPAAVTRLMNLLKNSPCMKSVHLHLNLPRTFVMTTCLIARHYDRFCPLFRTLMKSFYSIVASYACPILELEGIEKAVDLREPVWHTYISMLGNPRMFGFEVRGFVAGLIERHGLKGESVEELESMVLRPEVVKQMWWMGYEAAMRGDWNVEVGSGKETV